MEQCSGVKYHYLFEFSGFHVETVTGQHAIVIGSALGRF
jgi:hypothetical protein